MVNISHFVKSTKLLGPGNRFVIWFQGCNKSCNGCINPDGQKINGGKLTKIDNLLELIKSDTTLNGVTISGGEPFLQNQALLNLVRRIKLETNLDIMIYTGYLYSEIKFENQELLSLIDILVDGEYQENLNNNSLYRGSSNQKIYFLSNKYKNYQQQIEHSKSRNISFEINNEGEVFMIGIPPQGFSYEEFLKNLF